MKRPQWIRIEDELPPEGEDVLFALVIDGDNEGMPDIGKWTGETNKAGVIIMRDFYGEDEEGDFQTANLWLPLPSLSA